MVEKTAVAKRLADAGRTLVDARQQLVERVAYLEQRFNHLVSLDDEANVLRACIANEGRQLDAVRAEYVAKKHIYDRLVTEVAIFDERLAFAEMGVYEPHFDFSDSEAYKKAIASVRDLQKTMISAERAVVCTTQWTVDGDSTKGKMMTKRNIRLTLRAFNGECDAAIANTRWNNASAMEKRVLRVQEQIDKLNQSNSIFVTKPFVELKLKELRLTHEYREKLRAEREERTEAARQAREEQKLLRDVEKAEDEEAYYPKLLAKAKSEVAQATGPQMAAYGQQIEQLERDLAAAHAKFERAQSMAERTRSGYVYVISNIGSFGADVVKIGLTRRLDPIDRVRELGDASVPFVFDTHAIIYSDNAPSLEHALHAEFESSRINTQNHRKKFFRVSLEEVEAALTRIAPTAPFFKDIEAQEYRETLARRRPNLEPTADDARFPETV